MELTEDQLTDALEALVEDGDTFTLNDRFSLRLTIEVDEWSAATIQDLGDCYGWTEKFTHDYTEGHGHRPSEMDGAARKIQLDQGSYIWWQPADDMKSAKAWGGEADQYPAVFAAYLAQITDLLQYGFSVVGVEVWEHIEDVHGNVHQVRVDSAYIGGVDSTKPEHIRDLVSDLIADLAELPA